MLNLNYVYDDNDYEYDERKDVPRKKAMLNLNYAHDDNDYEYDERKDVPRRR